MVSGCAQGPGMMHSLLHRPPHLVHRRCRLRVPMEGEQPPTMLTATPISAVLTPHLNASRPPAGNTRSAGQRRRTPGAGFGPTLGQMCHRPHPRHYHHPRRHHLPAQTAVEEHRATETASTHSAAKTPPSHAASVLGCCMLSAGRAQSSAETSYHLNLVLSGFVRTHGWTYRRRLRLLIFRLYWWRI